MIENAPFEALENDETWSRERTPTELHEAVSRLNDRLAKKLSWAAQLADEIL